MAHQPAAPSISTACLTCDDHHADGEDLLVVGLGGHVAEADAGHARHGEVERGDVHGLPGGPPRQRRRHRLVRPDVLVRRLGDVGQLPQPAAVHTYIRVEEVIVHGERVGGQGRYVRTMWNRQPKVTPTHFVVCNCVMCIH